jgi:hypothetical protein
MANCDNLFRKFNENLQVPKSKRTAMTTSKTNLRKMIRDHFSKNHPDYPPTFWTQGSSKTKNMIRTKDDTCDLDDGVYFKNNPHKVTGTTLQRWVKEAVDGITEATPSHRKKCIMVDYKAGYNIDLPVFVFDEATDDHPKLAVKDDNFKTDDPKEFITKFNEVKDDGGQLIRITRYLKSWCDYRRHEMPRGLAMTVLAMDHIQLNDRDDVCLKYTLIEIEKKLKKVFWCVMPTTPHDDLFEDYDPDKQKNFMDHLASFIEDAKKAVDDEKNQLKASRLWQKNFGKAYFPDGEDEDEETTCAGSLSNTIGNAKPYRGERQL